jgi:hypothetical protein
MPDAREFPKYPPLFFVRFFDKLRKLFIHLSRRFTHPDIAVFEMVHNLWLSAAIGVAAELGLADILRNGKKPVSELASLTNTNEESLYRLMRMLASNDIFKEVHHRFFTITPLARALQEDHIKYLITSHLSKFHFMVFGELMHTVRTGISASELFINEPFYEHIGKDEYKNALFNKAMTSASMLQISAVLPFYHFSRFKKIIDIGGGEGLFIAAILRKCPFSKGVVFDLPQSSSNTREVLDIYKVTDRVDIITGSFFEKIPEDGDLYVVKNILHNWDDNACIAILGNIRKVMSSKTRLLIIETFVEEANKPSFGKMTDILMMAVTGGKERTIAEFKSLILASGLNVKKIYRTVAPVRLIEVVLT